jgi:hypothetical protein
MKQLLKVVLLCVLFVVVVNAQSGPTFFYVATAVDASGFESSFSNQITVAFGQGKHITALTWNASTSTVVGYNIYRGTSSGGPYVKLNATPIAALIYSDTFVLPNAPSGLAATQQ